MSKNINEHLVKATACGAGESAIICGDCQEQMEPVKQAILTDLMSLMPSRWETPKRRTYETDRQIGYNEALQEVEAAIKNYIKGE